MREKKQWRNIKKLLCLCLAMILVCSAVPVKSILAVESGTTQEVGATTETTEQDSSPESGEEASEVPDSEETETAEQASESDTILEPGDEMSEGTEAEASSEIELMEEAVEPVIDTNSISGKLWLDMYYDVDNSKYSGDGIYDAEESPLANYTVCLYAADDTDNTAQGDVTDVDENSVSENLEPDSDTTEVETEMIYEIEYLSPLWSFAGIMDAKNFMASNDVEADEPDKVVVTTTADEDGKYEFTNIEPGNYVVGVAATTMEGVEYLLPLWHLDGTEGDNRFVTTYDAKKDAYINAYTEHITIGADTVVTDMDAGMRTVPMARSMAAYDLDISTLTGTAVGNGVTISGTVATFDAAAAGNIYTVTGTTTTNYMVVTGGVAGNPVGIELQGVTIQTPLSPISLNGSANVTLTLDGDNLLRCTGTATTAVNQAGIHINTTAVLTIEGTGTLAVTAGASSAAIGGSNGIAGTNGGVGRSNGTLIINSGTITATGIIGGGSGGNASGNNGSGGAGGTGGTITINDGTITSASGVGGGNGGRGGPGIISTSGAIGGAGGASGIITVNGGTVNGAIRGGSGGTSSGASNGTVGAGRGGAGGAGSTITINDGTVTGHIGGGNGGAGGAGNNYPSNQKGNNAGDGGAGGIIRINGGNVRTLGGGSGGAGGSGPPGGDGGDGGIGGTITITDGTVIGHIGGGNGGRGGNGMLNYAGQTGASGGFGGIGGAGGTITIIGGTITAVGVASGSADSSHMPKSGAGIGGGSGAMGGTLGGGAAASDNFTGMGGAGGSITIRGGTVSATGRDTAKDIGPGSVATAGTIIITGGSVLPTRGVSTTYVSPAPTNGSTYGAPDVVRMVTFTGYAAGQPFSIVASGTKSNYSYNASAHANGNVYAWLTYPGVSTDTATNVNTTPASVTAPSTVNSVESSTATLNGSYYLNTTYAVTNAYFEWGTTTAYGNTETVSTTSAITAGIYPVASPALTGLSPGITYHYRFVIRTGPSGTITLYGSDETFTPPALAPSVDVTHTISGNNATLSGIYALNGGTFISGQFEISTDGGSTWTTPAVTGATLDGMTTTPSVTLTGLSAGIYDYRFTVTNSIGMTQSTINSFTILDKYTITEKYVDQNGNTIIDSSSIPMPDTIQMVNAGSSYNGVADTISDYICIGYKIGTDTDTFATATIDEAYGVTNPTINNIAADHTVFFIYTKASITVEKFEADGTTPLAGAKFKLEKMNAGGTAVDPGVPAQEITTTGTGTIQFENLVEGKYQITEVTAPGGFSTLKEAIQVDLPYSSTAAPTGSYTYKTSVGGTDTYYYYQLTYKVTDQAELDMPVAGSGFLSQYYVWIGMGIVLAAGSSFAFRQRRRRLQEK